MDKVLVLKATENGTVGVEMPFDKEAGLDFYYQNLDCDTIDIVEAHGLVELKLEDFCLVCDDEGIGETITAIISTKKSNGEVCSSTEFMIKSIIRLMNNHNKTKNATDKETDSFMKGVLYGYSDGETEFNRTHYACKSSCSGDEEKRICNDNVSEVQYDPESDFGR